MAPRTAQQAAPAAAPRPWQVAAGRRIEGAITGGWPADRRAAALARLDEAGLPDDTQEDWRYTSLAPYTQRWTRYLAATGQSPATAASAEPRRQGHAVAAPTTVDINVVDGILRPQPADLPRGLAVGSLGQLPAELLARAGELLRKSGDVAPDALVDLNSALLTDVLLIATDGGSDLGAAPVHVRLQAAGAPAFSQPRLLVDVAEGSRLTLIIEHTGADGALVNAVTEAWVGRGGHLSLIRVQALPDDGMLTETTRIEAAAGAVIGITSVDLGGQLSRQALTVLLAGPGASAAVDGMFLADGRRHIDNRTRLEHKAPATSSRESYRGIADGHGHGIFNGKIIVQPGAAGSTAALTNRNLLLAATAEIDTKPELEIYVDDVRCSHGATTGQLDANALFYLRSRGLDPAAARQVLTAAFLRETLGGIAVPELRARLDAELQAKLGGDLAIAGPGTAS